MDREALGVIESHHNIMANQRTDGSVSPSNNILMHAMSDTSQALSHKATREQLMVKFPGWCISIKVGLQASINTKCSGI